MFKLRDFLYLDERVIKRYLSSIEEGLVKEVLQTDISKKPNWDFEVSLGDLQSLLATAGIPMPNIGIKRNSKSQNISVQITKEPTIDSQFDKLFKYLDPVLQYLEGFDPAIWSQLTNGQFVYYSSEVKLSKGYKDAQMLKMGAELYSFAKEFGEKNDDFEELLNGSQGYREELASKKFTEVYSIPTGSPNKKKYYFVGKLIHENLVDIDLEDLSFGEAFTLARVEHVLQPGDDYTMYDATLTGADKMLNREQRRKQKKELFEFAKSPAIVIKPIAIFKE